MLKEDIINKIINCQPDYKKLVITYWSIYNSLKEHDVIDKGLLHKEFSDVVKSILVDEITKDLACSSEEVYIILNDLNLDEYLKL